LTPLPVLARAPFESLQQALDKAAR
jgi:hypothetical protein